MEENEIQITLKASVWGAIINALAGRPYSEVYAIIAEIQRQANMQAAKDEPAS